MRIGSNVLLSPNLKPHGHAVIMFAIQASPYSRVLLTQSSIATDTSAKYRFYAALLLNQTLTQGGTQKSSRTISDHSIALVARIQTAIQLLLYALTPVAWQQRQAFY